jgi:hypothetical protein
VSPVGTVRLVADGRRIWVIAAVGDYIVDVARPLQLLGFRLSRPPSSLAATVVELAFLRAVIRHGAPRWASTAQKRRDFAKQLARFAWIGPRLNRA